MRKHYTLVLALLCSLSIFNSPAVLHAQQTATAKKTYHIPLKPQDVIMYQVFVHNFSAAGTLNEVTNQLQRIKDLGANTVYLLPIQPIGVLNRKGKFGSPYSISDYSAVNPDLGTLDDVKKLVETAHKMHLSVIMDWVGNHTAWDSKWITQHPDWYKHDSTGKIIPPNPDWTDVAALNYKNNDLRKAMTDGMLFWVDNYDMDGFRCDAADLVPTDFWKSVIDELNKRKPVLMLCEADKANLYGAGFNMNYGWNLYGTEKKIWKEKKTGSAYAETIDKDRKKYEGYAYRPIRFITDHDENSWDNTPNVLFNGDNGMMAAFTLMTFSEGVPFIYDGQESAFPTRINLFEKYTITYDGDPSLTQYYKDIFKLYAEREDIRIGQTVYDTVATTGVRITKTLGTKGCVLIANTSLYNTLDIRALKKEHVLIQRGYTDGILSPYGFVVFDK